MTASDTEQKKRWVKIMNLPLVITLIVTLSGTTLLFIGTNAARERGRRAACNGNLLQIGMGLHGYSGDNEETFPQGLQELMPYIKQTELFECQSSDWRNTPRPTSNTLHLHGSYFYIAGRSEADDSDAIHMFDDPRNHATRDNPGAFILFIGGYAQYVPFESEEPGDPGFWDILAYEGITRSMVMNATSRILRAETLKLPEGNSYFY